MFCTQVRDASYKRGPITTANRDSTYGRNCLVSVPGSSYLCGDQRPWGHSNKSDMGVTHDTGKSRSTLSGTSLPSRRQAQHRSWHEPCCRQCGPHRGWSDLMLFCSCGTGSSCLSACSSYRTQEAMKVWLPEAWLLRKGTHTLPHGSGGLRHQQVSAIAWNSEC